MKVTGRKPGESLILTEGDRVLALVTLVHSKKGSSKRIAVNADPAITITRLEDYAAGGDRWIHKRGVRLADFEQIEAQYEARLAEQEQIITTLREQLASQETP